MDADAPSTRRFCRWHLGLVLVPEEPVEPFVEVYDDMLSEFLDEDRT